MRLGIDIVGVRLNLGTVRVRYSVDRITEVEVGIRYIEAIFKYSETLR